MLLKESDEKNDIRLNEKVVNNFLLKIGNYLNAEKNETNKEFEEEKTKENNKFLSFLIMLVSITGTNASVNFIDRRSLGKNLEKKDELMRLSIEELFAICQVLKSPSIRSMIIYQGVKELSDNFVVRVENFYKTIKSLSSKLGIKFSSLLTSISSIFNRKGIPKAVEIEFFLEAVKSEWKKLREKGIEIEFLELLKSISSVFSGRDISKVVEIGFFLEAVELEWKKLREKGIEIEFLELLVSISSIFNRRGYQEEGKEEICDFLETVKSEWKALKKLEVKTRFIKLLKSVSNEFNGRGLPKTEDIKATVNYLRMYLVAKASREKQQQKKK